MLTGTIPQTPSEHPWQTHTFQKSDFVQGRLCEHLSAPHHLQSHEASVPAAESQAGDLLNLGDR